MQIGAKQEGASKNDIDQMPKFRFRKIDNNEKLPGEASNRGIMTECGTDSPIERSLSPEDAVLQFSFRIQLYITQTFQ